MEGGGVKKQENKEIIFFSLIDLIVVSTLFFCIHSQSVLAFDCTEKLILDEKEHPDISKYTLQVIENKKVANFYLRKARFYEKRSFSSENDNSIKQEWDLALVYSLCAANAGSTEAAIFAANLTLSGQSLRLNNNQIESLYIYGVKTHFDMAPTLADFYCDSGRYQNSSIQGCDNPEKAIFWLEYGAKKGSSIAQYFLGKGYETGEFGVADINKAISCYKLSSDHGNLKATKKLSFLKAKNSASKAICYK